jgi:hypothetical protein
MFKSKSLPIVAGAAIAAAFPAAAVPVRAAQPNLRVCEWIAYRISAYFVAVLLAVCLLPASAKAGFITDTLGSAGPSNFAILTLSGGSDIALNGPGQSHGNVGISSGTLSLNGSAGPEVNGNVFLATGANISGNPSQVTGSVFTNQNLSQANTDARNASTTFASLTPTQNVPGGSINGTATINGSSGINVIDIASLNLGNGQTLTLNGPAGAQFVIDDSGNFVLNSGKIVLTGGIGVTDVVFNIEASGNAISTSGGLNNESVINGIVLAPNSGVAMAPGLINGELIAGGSTIHIVSGGSVNSVPAVVPAPLIGRGLPVLLAVGGMLFGARLWERSKKRSLGTGVPHAAA